MGFRERASKGCEGGVARFSILFYNGSCTGCVKVLLGGNIIWSCTEYLWRGYGVITCSRHNWLSYGYLSKISSFKILPVGLQYDRCEYSVKKEKRKKICTNLLDICPPIFKAHCYRPIGRVSILQFLNSIFILLFRFRVSRETNLYFLINFLLFSNFEGPIN
jgi:hypothetical protein